MQISWGLARRTAVASVVLVGLAGAVQASPAAAEGNSVAAHACQEGGYTRMVGVQDGQITTFATTGACVSYAAQGGRLVATSVVQPCLNGGYADLATSEDNTTPFSSEAACVSYAASGGGVVPVVDPIVVDPRYYGFYVNTFSVAECLINIEVDGLAPSTTYKFVATTISDSRTLTHNQFRTADADGHADLVFNQDGQVDQTITVQAYDATGAVAIGSPSAAYRVTSDCNGRR